jgi:hypothetical protein
MEFWLDTMEKVSLLNNSISNLQLS